MVTNFGFESQDETTMTDNPSAEIIAIGTEILLGELTDTNSVFIAQQLRDAGVNIYFMTSVGDNQVRIASAIQIALQRADIVITCGGLGPTVDDMTRQGVAQAFGVGLTFYQVLLDQIAARFEMYRVRMTENNRQQANLPDGATPIENPVGTAPGFMMESDGKTVISLPGVPREMKFLMQQVVLPYLHQRYQLGVIKARTLKTAGVGESALDDLLGGELLNGSNPTVGLAAHHGTIDIRMTAKAASLTAADAMLDAVQQQVLERVGDYVFGEGQKSIEDALIDSLVAQNAKLVIIEAGIADAIAGKLKDISRFGDVATHIGQFAHPDDLRAVLGLNAQSSLRDVAQVAAEHFCHEHQAQACIAIASLPDVDEGADKLEATSTAIYTLGEAKSRVYGFGAQSELAQDWASRWAMANVWRIFTRTASAQTKYDGD
jgi:nicotinamide-nucleotide amidase